MSDFKVGERVKTIDGKEGPIESIKLQSRRWGTGCSSEMVTYFVEGEEYLSGQLTKVEPPKPPESGWLLTEEQMGEIRIMPSEGYTAAMMVGAEAEARHLVEEAMRRNSAATCFQELRLCASDWEDLQRAVGLL